MEIVAVWKLTVMASGSVAALDMPFVFPAVVSLKHTAPALVAELLPHFKAVPPPVLVINTTVVDQADVEVTSSDVFVQLPPKLLSGVKKSARFHANVRLARPGADGVARPDDLGSFWVMMDVTYVPQELCDAFFVRMLCLAASQDGVWDGESVAPTAESFYASAVKQQLVTGRRALAGTAMAPAKASAILMAVDTVSGWGLVHYLVVAMEYPMLLLVLVPESQAYMESLPPSDRTPEKLLDWFVYGRWVFLSGLVRTHRTVCGTTVEDLKTVARRQLDVLKTATI